MDSKPSIQKLEKKRDSNFELLRLFAIFSVLMYHGISYFIVNYSPDNNYGHILWLPFRTAVSLFILISGYYGIRFSCRGIFNLLIKVIVYYIPIQLIAQMFHYTGIKDVIYSFMPISNGPYWFITVYLCLYLLSPIINEYLSKVKVRDGIYLIGILSFMSLYLGFIGPYDNSLALGKNVIHFILLYTIGNRISKYKEVFSKVPSYYYVLTFIFFNILVVVFFIHFSNTKIYYLTCIFDRDNGIALLCNAIITFLFFSKLHFHSQFVNSIARSVFAVYILQQQPTISHFLYDKFNLIWMPLSIFNCESLADTFTLVGYIFVRSLFAICVFVLLDKALQPLWTILGRGFETILIHLKKHYQWTAKEF